MRYVLAVLAAGLLAAACSGSVPHPPSARDLAAKIHGCTRVVTQPGSALATGDAICRLPAGSGVEVATFATMSDERQWILGQGNVYGCCVEGHLWAADYYSQANQFPAIIRALGGRPVTG